MQGIGILIAIAVACVLAYKAFIEISAWVTGDGKTIVMIAAAAIAFTVWAIYYLVTQPERSLTKAMGEARPDGPMQVSLEENMEEGPRGAKCSLNIDVRISKKDWAAIEGAGLMDHTAFSWKNPNSPWPENPDNFHIRSLAKPFRAWFFNTIDMQRAKAELIETLHSLRTQMDSHREAAMAPRKDSFEL